MIKNNMINAKDLSVKLQAFLDQAVKQADLRQRVLIDGELYLEIQANYNRFCETKDPHALCCFCLMYSAYYGLRNLELKNENKARVLTAYADKLLEPAENNEDCFESTLRRLSRETGRKEVSYSSKLAATRNSSLPVIDRHVKHVLEISAISTSSVDKWLEIYGQIKERYEALEKIPLANGKFFEDCFDELWSNLKGMTLVKKADHIVWEIGKEDERVNRQRKKKAKEATNEKTVL